MSPNGGPHYDELHEAYGDAIKLLAKRRRFLQVAERLLRQVVTEHYAGDMAHETVANIEQFLREDHGTK